MDIIDKALAWWNDDHNRNFEHFNNVKKILLEARLLTEADKWEFDEYEAAVKSNRSLIEQELIKKRLKDQ